MRQSLEKLVDLSTDVMKHLEVQRFELNYYEDDAFCEFMVKNIPDITKLAILTQGYRCGVFHGDYCLLIRIYENIE